MKLLTAQRRYPSFRASNSLPKFQRLNTYVKQLSQPLKVEKRDCIFASVTGQEVPCVELENDQEVTVGHGWMGWGDWTPCR